jgi:hypothetical protein
MTLQEAKSIARHLPLTLRKMRSSDYRVNLRDGNETTAYYTDNLEDAIIVNERCEPAPHRESLAITRRFQVIADPTRYAPTEPCDLTFDRSPRHPSVL